MRDKFLHHLTLTTGHTRRSYRSEVTDDAVEWARHVIYVGTQRKELVPLGPLGDDYRLMISPPENTKTLKCVVLRGSEPVVTFGVASHSTRGAALWRELVDSAQTPVAVTDCPPEPWIVARLELGAAATPGDVMAMIGDMERCIGWGFVEPK